MQANLEAERNNWYEERKKDMQQLEQKIVEGERKQETLREEKHSLNVSSPECMSVPH